jgi:TonB family protein
MISDKITANWFQSLVDPGVGGLLQTQVYFRIYRTGQISDIRIDVSSGVEAFDISARRAIQASAPFASLPNEYDGQYLGITLIFEHAK